MCAQPERECPHFCAPWARSSASRAAAAAPAGTDVRIQISRARAGRREFEFIRVHVSMRATPMISRCGKFTYIRSFTFHSIHTYVRMKIYNHNVVLKKMNDCMCCMAAQIHPSINLRKACCKENASTTNYLGRRLKALCDKSRFAKYSPIPRATHTRVCHTWQESFGNF